MKSSTANPFGDIINLSEMETGADKQIIVCGATGIPVYKDVSGDITISNLGAVAIGSGVIVNDDINTNAAIVISKLAAGADKQIIVCGATGIPVYKDVSGDITISNLGATTLKNTGPGVQSTTYSSITIDAQGRVTAASSGTLPADVFAILLKGHGGDGAFAPGADAALAAGDKNYSSINIAAARTMTTTVGQYAQYIKCAGDCTIAGTLATGGAILGPGVGTNGTDGTVLCGPFSSDTLTKAITAPTGGTKNTTFGGGGGGSVGAGGASGGGANGGAALKGYDPIYGGWNDVPFNALVDLHGGFCGATGGASDVANNTTRSGSAIFLDVYGNLTLSGILSSRGGVGATDGTNEGTGGHGGGCIFIRCFGNFNGTGGTINTSGGNGGAGGSADGDGGGGGGGGLVIILCAGTYTAPTITTAGGTGGAKGAAAGNAGSNGSAGTSKVFN